jgi:protein SCO1/2
MRCGAFVIISACLCVCLASASKPDASETIRTFPGTGVVLAVQPDTHTIVIRHEAISNYMAAMTMPFNVKTDVALAGWQRGDKVVFQLHVNAIESWVDHFAKIGSSVLPPEKAASREPAQPTLLDVNFTNELGQPVKLNDFRGQALAVTFFYTRCPLPDFCPRLSKNFETASRKLAGLPRAPTNWHFISISFDSEFDSPAMLKTYGEFYHYDPAHWSFLTGPRNKIRELAEQCGLTYEADGAAFNHNFRTLIVDASGHLQHVFITGGDLSDEIVSEMLKAMVVTNEPSNRS